MIHVSKHNIPSLSYYTYKPGQSKTHAMLLQPTKQTKAMGGIVAPREDVFHNQSLNHLKPHFNYIDDKPPFIRAQITAKPTTTDVPSYFKPKDNSLLPIEVNYLGKRPDESEISIFDAEKYFNGANRPRQSNITNNSNHANDGIFAVSNLKQPSISRRVSLSSTPKQSISPIARLSDDSYGRTYRPRPSHGAPTASSESSWNSKTGLLTNPPGLVAVSLRNLRPPKNRTTGRKTTASMKWFLRGNRCPCSGKKSVNISRSNSNTETSKTAPPPPPRIVQLNRISCGGSDRSVYSSRQSSPRITNTNPNSDDRVAVTVRSFADASGTTSNGFTFPILNTSANPPKRMFNIVPPITSPEKPRESLEVFRPQEVGFTFKTSPISRRASHEEEMRSDASSDLFEIESFSTTTHSTLVFPHRDSLEDPSTSAFSAHRYQIAAVIKDDDEEEELYAPSEVSVDWSVTTAEGLERGSVGGMSEGWKGGDGRRRGGLLRSCRREEAVSVGPGPIKCRQAQRGGM